MGVGFCPLCAGAAQLSAVPFRDDANREIHPAEPAGLGRDGVPGGVQADQAQGGPAVTSSGSTA